MREHAGVARKQLRTSNYSQEARTRLGEAVEAARIAAGYRFRTDFCRAHGIKNLRGLELLEQGKTGVGQAFLYEVADALPNWTRETMRTVLEGGPIPPIKPPLVVEPEPEEEPWTEEDERVYDALVKLVGEGRLRLRVVQAIEEDARKRAGRNERNSSDTAS